MLLFSAGTAQAQYRVKGTVFDNTGSFPIEAVSVMGTNGALTVTDSSGRYSIQVREQDSIWFSYQGKPTPKYAVLNIQDVNRFDLALKIKLDILPEVRIRTRRYYDDSLENRRNYAKVFDYNKPSLGSMTSVGPTGAGIDVNELIRLFQFRKNKSMLRFQQRLILEEQDKFIDRKFNKPLVRLLTGFKDDELQQFMQAYRPTYEFAAMATDYDFRRFIKIAAAEYRKSKEVSRPAGNL